MDEAKVIEAAKKMFDNMIGYSSGTQLISAQRGIWVELGEALYGPDDRRVKELKLLP